MIYDELNIFFITISIHFTFIFKKKNIILILILKIIKVVIKYIQYI